jgi:DNA-binding winged helix-turn-helix (wHTH) protein
MVRWVFTRDQLLRAVWGYAYFGGPRTVDVHIRRLRVKLGTASAYLIGTVRQVGYTFVRPPSQITAGPITICDYGKVGINALRPRTGT